MRNDKAQNLARFHKWIEKIIKAEPFERDGEVWAARPQCDWAEMVGVSDRTIRRLQLDPSIIATNVLVDDIKQLLLRPAANGPKSHNLIAKDMAKLWKDKLGRTADRNDFGRFCGLSAVLPSDCQVDILRVVLDDWSYFMVCVKEHLREEDAAIEEHSVPFLKYPSTSVIRRFPDIAIEIYESWWQKNHGNEAPPKALACVHPHLWASLHQADLGK